MRDSFTRSWARSGVPQTRTRKQDNALLFLDYLHAEVEVADTITSFFVRPGVYFAFLGKSTPHGLVPDRDQPMGGGGGVPPSPLFVEEEEPSDSYEQTVHAAPSSGPTHDWQEEPQEDGTGPSEARPSIARQQPPRRRNAWDHLKRRRRKVRMRGVASRPATEREEEQEEPIEWELLNTETQDHETSDQSSPHNENISLRESIIEPTPVDSAPSAMYDAHGSTGAGDADAASDCTRISIEANGPAHDPDEGGLIVVPNQDDALNDPAKINNALPPASPESEPTQSSTTVAPPGSKRWMHTSPTYKELRKSRSDWNRNWRLPSGHPPRVVDQQNSPQLASDDEPAVPVQTDRELTIPAINVTSPDLPSVPLHDGQPESIVENSDEGTLVSRDVIRKHSSHPSSTDDSGSTGAVLPQPQPGPVEIHFWAFEREQWRQCDRLLVNPSDPSPLERLARKYTWKDYSLNAIFMISEHEEQELIAAGRLTKKRQLLAMISRALDRVEEETGSIPPGRFGKQRQS
ncbi:hypothetical protein POX_c04568 [Penicillium oxalicum]|uniref:hypothetical protein n=1 Tax=Penicillium oxalicum TaxID=69781 RepID=UPI0020B8A1E7|nr:hypothetical protein POX_c04568 [Penicillium oxalicum]KAI2791699.1 hypothetical protein POX_c04568 [Penicillium oxalicum]